MVYSGVKGSDPGKISFPYLGSSSRSRRKLSSALRCDAHGDKTKALAETRYHKEVRLIAKMRHGAEQHESAKADHRGVGEKTQLWGVRQPGLFTFQPAFRRIDSFPGGVQEEQVEHQPWDPKFRGDLEKRIVAAQPILGPGIE